tara:strand:+ start:237 stop:512 length:276 start_codon:yes stop_codon:yes gene_type:complete
MNRLYTRGLFKQFLKDWKAVVFETQIEPTKIARNLSTEKKGKNKFDIENEKWFSSELSSSEEWIDADKKENDLLHLLPQNKDDTIYNERED